MSNSLHDHIETIESGYEYLLAYAAQGRESDSGPDFNAVVVDDAKKAGAAMALVLEQEQISSELVDNLNASIHLRALLTDLFLLSETSN